MLRRPYQLMLIAVVILAVFYPVIHAEICIVDDGGMINDLLNDDHFSIRQLFLPRAVAAGYYRPMLFLTFYLDKLLWFMDSNSMHLENILLHLLNALLVYALTLRLLPEEQKRESYLPLVAGLLFGLHPIVTESVDWISGRTDLLATNFVLLSAILLFNFLEKRSKLTFAAALAALLAGMLAKEVAFGFVFAAFFILTARRIRDDDDLPTGALPGVSAPIVYAVMVSLTIILVLFIDNYWLVPAMGIVYLLLFNYPRFRGRSLQTMCRDYLKTFILLLVAAVLTAGSFWALRRIVFASNIPRIGQTLKLMLQDTSYAIALFLGAAGFYLKKFFFPLPLNFFIREVDPLYQLLGIAVFFYCLYLAVRRTREAALFLAGVCMFIPAFPFAFGTIAWTAYAERYIYASTAFWSIAGALYLSGKVEAIRAASRVRCLVPALTAALLVAAAIATVKRNHVWQSSLALVEDTVAKSPRAKIMRGFYMVALARAGSFKAAEEQYRIASSLPEVGYDPRYDLNMAELLKQERNYAEAERMYQKVLARTKGKLADGYELYDDLLLKLFRAEQDRSRRAELLGKWAGNMDKHLPLEKDPYVLYKMGRQALALGDRRRAAACFEKAHELFPAGNDYKTYTAKLIGQLKR